MVQWDGANNMLARESASSKLPPRPAATIKEVAP